MRIVLATANRHKLIEVSAMFADSAYTVVGLDEFPEIGDIPEPFDTMEENATHKAQTVFSHTGLPTVADDSGIEIRALDWAPGVISKRWTEAGTDHANNDKLLAELSEKTDRMARYRCAIALVTSNGVLTAEGTCSGTIGTERRGDGGFGYDPLFWPNDYPGRTMAELTLDEKNRISHRARAFAHLPDMVAKLLG